MIITNPLSVFHRCVQWLNMNDLRAFIGGFRWTFFG